MARPRVIPTATVLAAAREVFLARGAEAPTRAVAAAAGVSEGVLYQRFGTKRRLFFAAMVPPPPDLASLLGPRPPATPRAARADLVRIAAALLVWMSDAMPGALRAALHPGFPEALGPAHGTSGADGLVTALAERIHAMRGAGALRQGADPGAVARAFLDLLHGSALVALLSPAPPEDAGRRARRAVAVLWHGLAPGRDLVR
jgi:AcrR family transcriptional regulator